LTGDPSVSITRCASYEGAIVADAIRACLGPLGGVGAFVRPGQRVLLKPNFVVARAATEPCNTHPEFILAVARLVRERGAEPVVGDSPAMGTAGAVARKLGLSERLREAGVPLVEFTRGERFRSDMGDCTVTIAREVIDADVVINLPKLKTHQQAGMTCCVKNLFGCVVGRRKAFLHFLCGGEEERFGGMLLDVARMARPALHVVDGIVAMHRGGPIRGEAIEFGAVLAGADPVAADTVAFHLAGADHDGVCTHRAARRAGIAGTRLDAIDLRGVPIAAMRCPRLEPPALMVPLNFSPWHIVRGWMKHQWRMRFARPA
jgi:uncharacterized protein (DUF362 family)